MKTVILTALPVVSFVGNQNAL